MPMPLIEAQQVSREYPKNQCTALRGVTLAIGRGEFVAIMGPSGSGKSTLLHILCGLDSATSGRVLVDGAEPRSSSAWASIRARRVGFVFQAFNLLPTLTARQNVEVPMFGIQSSARERRRRAEGLVARVGLAHRMVHKPAELSGGEKQRLAIARSLANAPEIILADEPTGNLDSKTSGDILDLLEAVRREEGTALVIVTHDGAIAGRAEKIVSLKDGRIVSQGEG